MNKVKNLNEQTLFIYLLFINIFNMPNAIKDIWLEWNHRSPADQPIPCRYTD
jgi:hypothetical protein